MCWNSTEAGTTVVQPCPNYIHKFLLNGKISHNQVDIVFFLPSKVEIFQSASALGNHVLLHVYNSLYHPY